MKKTIRGVYHDLNDSDYIVISNNIKFYFSSKLYKDKFIKKREENNAIINYSLKKRFKVNFKTEILADVLLYSKIEIRGFRIIYNEQEYRSLKELEYIIKL